MVHVKDGSKIPGTIVASTQIEMIVAGDDGIGRKIPMAQVKSVEYGAVARGGPGRGASSGDDQDIQTPLGSDVSVRTNEAIDSATAAEGQTFDAEVTRDAQDADGDVVIPRGSRARIVIESASKGGRFRGQSDLVLDTRTVAIDGKQYMIDAAEIGKKGKPGLGTNKRTAEYTGSGAVLGAVIGAIAVGGRGAAIGAGGGALTQALTKGGAIKVPVESMLTFELDKPLRGSVAR